MPPPRRGRRRRDGDCRPQSPPSVDSLRVICQSSPDRSAGAIGLGAFMPRGARSRPSVAAIDERPQIGFDTICRCRYSAASISPLGRSHGSFGKKCHTSPTREQGTKLGNSCEYSPSLARFEFASCCQRIGDRSLKRKRRKTLPCDTFLRLRVRLLSFSRGIVHCATSKLARRA